MTPFIAEFILDSDLRPPDDQESLVWSDGNVRLEIWSATKKTGPVAKALKAHLEFQSENLQQAKEDCQDILARILNSICLVTSCSIRQSELTRVVDWSLGITMRDALYFNRTPRIARTEPALTKEVLNSAQLLDPALQSNRAQTALRWFRIGLSLSSAEEQFIHFWFALENAAEALKGEERIAHKCPDCNSDLACKTCNSTPLHRKFAAEAIRDLVMSSLSGEEADRRAALKAMLAVRHALMHGRRMTSALRRTDFDESAVTNLLAQVTRISLFKLIDPSSAPAGNLEILESSDVVRGEMVMSAHVQTVFGPPNEPKLSANEGIQMSIRYPGDEES